MRACSRFPPYARPRIHIHTLPHRKHCLCSIKYSWQIIFLRTLIHHNLLSVLSDGSRMAHERERERVRERERTSPHRMNRMATEAPYGGAVCALALQLCTMNMFCSICTCGHNKAELGAFRLTRPHFVRRFRKHLGKSIYSNPITMHYLICRGILVCQSQL